MKTIKIIWCTLMIMSISLILIDIVYMGTLLGLEILNILSFQYFSNRMDFCLGIGILLLVVFIKLYIINFLSLIFFDTDLSNPYSKP